MKHRNLSKKTKKDNEWYKKGKKRWENYLEDRDLAKKREKKFDIEWNSRERDPFFIVKERERESPCGVV